MPTIFRQRLVAIIPLRDYRSTLTWSDRVGNLGSVDIYNFYSGGEEILRENKTDAPASEVGMTANNVGYWIQHIYTDNLCRLVLMGFNGRKY